MDDHSIHKMYFNEIFPPANFQNTRFELLADELDDFGNAEVF